MSEGERGLGKGLDVAMLELTAEGTQALTDLAARHGVSVDAVRTLLFAVASGNGAMAQFYHAELGGGGQWMRGGMTMVGDMFNQGLQAKVADLCTELASLLASRPVFAEVASGETGAAHAPARANAYSTQGSWWPAHLGIPSAAGGQNETRYAYFPEARRLALLQNGRLAIHDTLDHRIGGVQQQQGGASGSLSFTSQRGTFGVDSLPAVSGEALSGEAPIPPREAAPSRQANDREDVLAAIERLAELHKKNILSDDEFRSKKAELLGRL